MVGSSLILTEAQLEEQRLGASHPVMEKKMRTKLDLVLTECFSNGKTLFQAQAQCQIMLEAFSNFPLTT